MDDLTDECLFWHGGLRGSLDMLDMKHKWTKTRKPPRYKVLVHYVDPPGRWVCPRES